jgi:Fe-S-cluster containining protein
VTEATLVVRPVFRSYKQRFVRACAEHVRAGGHAVVFETEERAYLVLPPIDADDPHDLGFWSILDLGKQRWTTETEGPLEGLSTTRVPRGCLDLVKKRATRDSEFTTSTRKMKLDCLECGACCRDNHVILEPEDYTRFAEHGRPELGKPPFTKRFDGKVVFKLAKDKACQHLCSDNKCDIYAMRPNACSTFPMASECCLYAREEELGIVDGVRIES